LLATYATETGADGVLFTCSAFASAIDEAKRQQRTPVFKADEAMIDMALRAGPRIGVLATLPAAAAAAEAQIHVRADGNGEPVTVVSRTLDRARQARAGGDVAAFDRLIAEGAYRLSQHVDVICLAQYSMARAQDAAKRVTAVPLLAGPRSAASRLRSQLAPTADASSGFSGGT
jgi:Asp/Glu/hydantoin racemase